MRAVMVWVHACVSPWRPENVLARLATPTAAAAHNSLIAAPPSMLLSPQHYNNHSLPTHRHLNKDRPVIISCKHHQPSAPHTTHR